MKRRGAPKTLLRGDGRLLAGIVLVGAMVAATAADGISERAKRLHFSSLVVDTHDDTTQRFLDGDFDLLQWTE